MTADRQFARRVATLRARQLRGEVPPPGRISEAALAAQLGLSEDSVRRTLARGLAKLAAGLRARGVTREDIPSRD